MTAPTLSSLTPALCLAAGTTLAAGEPAGLPLTDPAKAETGTEDAVGSKTLLMHYMPWYVAPTTRGYWGGHWTGWQKQHDPESLDGNGLPDLYSHYHPLIGPYDSSDPDVVECHLLQMKLAGVDGVIVDWYGIKDHHDYGVNHVGSQTLFEQAGEMGMAFAVCYEDRTVEELVKGGVVSADRVGEHLAETFTWLHENWFGAPQYLRMGGEFEGRPLLLNFGPVYATEPSDWSTALDPIEPRPAYFALQHLWKGIGADGGYTWVHADVWEGDPDHETVLSRLDGVFTHPSDNPQRVITSALPGFKDVYEHSYPTVEHRGGDTMRESLEAAIQADSPVVQLVTWNDYGEGTMIEPTHEFGYLFLEIIQDAVREQREGFSFTHEDLRLPARLLELRRSGEHRSFRLDRIAGMLADGRVDEARTALERLGG